MGDLLGPPSGRDLNKMKLVALLALVGFAAASIEAPGEGTRVSSPMTSPWKSNTEYTYESKLTVQPSSCSTKEIEFVLKFGYATKEKGQSIIYHKMEPSQGKLVKVTSRPIGEMSGHIRRQEKVKSMIEKLQVNSEGKAFTVTVSTILKGGRP